MPLWSYLPTAMIAGVIFLSPASGRAADQTFTLVNRTGLTLTEVYVSPATSDEWGENGLGQGVLEKNDRIKIRFNRAEKACDWDLKVLDSTGASAEWTDFDLCQTSTILIYFNSATGETWAEYE